MEGVAVLLALAKHDHPPSGLMPPVRPGCPPRGTAASRGSGHSRNPSSGVTHHHPIGAAGRRGPRSSGGRPSASKSIRPCVYLSVTSPPRHASPPPSCLPRSTGFGRSPLSWYFRAPRSAGLAVTALEEPEPTEVLMAEGSQEPFLREVPFHCVAEARKLPA